MSSPITGFKDGLSGSQNQASSRLNRNQKSCTILAIVLGCILGFYPEWTMAETNEDTLLGWIIVKETPHSDEELEEMDSLPYEPQTDCIKPPCTRLSLNLLLGLPTGFQGLFAFDINPFFQVQAGGGTAFFADTYDVGLEAKIPDLPALRIGVGYQWFNLNGLGQNFIATRVNDAIFRLDPDIKPLDPHDFQFASEGAYFKIGLQAKRFRIETGLTKYNYSEVATMLTDNLLQVYESWAENNLDSRNTDGLALGVQEIADQLPAIIERNLEHAFFPHGVLFIRFGFNIDLF